MSMLNTIRKFIAMLFVGIMFLGVSTNGAEPHTVLDEVNCNLNFFVASDIHIEGNQYGKFKDFSKMLYDIKNNAVGTDAAVFLGDNTMNGQDIESMFFFGALNKVSPADNILVALGNHDVGNGDGNYAKLSKRFVDYNNTFLDADIKKPYYYKVINGYYFIFLATEESTVHEMAVTQEQLDFLRETMELASADGKPIFVFNHHPLVSEKGEFYGSIEKILADYKNVFYIFGHTHWTLNGGAGFYDSHEENTVIHVLNVPRLTDIADDDPTGENTGVGFAIEAYDDEVVLRARNCYNGKWLENYTYTIPIEK